MSLYSLLLCNGVDNKKPGSYKVTYVATDKEGESTTFEAIVVVEEAKQSVSNPVMTVTNKNIQIRQGDKFNPLAGVTATDYQGRKLTVNVTGSYDVEVVGSYNIVPTNPAIISITLFTAFSMYNFTFLLLIVVALFIIVS